MMILMVFLNLNPNPNLNLMTNAPCHSILFYKARQLNNDYNNNDNTPYSGPF